MSHCRTNQPLDFNNLPTTPLDFTLCHYQTNNTIDYNLCQPLVGLSTTKDFCIQTAQREISPHKRVFTQEIAIYLRSILAYKLLQKQVTHFFKNIEEIKSQLDFESCFAIDVNGRSGRLGLLWRHAFNYHLLNFSSNFINVQVHQTVFPTWRLIAFYGILEKERRKDSWNLLQTLGTNTSLPWCIFGDFNDL